MLLDAGIATVYRQTLISDPGDMPRYQWAEIWKSFYGEKTVGLTRYYAGMDHNDQIDLLIQVQRNRGIVSGDRPCGNRRGILSDHAGAACHR